MTEEDSHEDRNGATGRLLRAGLVRGAGFLAFWVVLIGADLAHLPVGLVTATAATWASLHLLPPFRQPVRLAALIALALQFLWQSVLAGWDVACRAFHPRLPLQPGFVSYPVGLPPGPARNAFTTLTSLLPGTLPAGDEGGALLYHCLDTSQPVLSQLAAEETVLTRALGLERDG